MFRVSEGVGVQMKNRVYKLHSFHSKFHLFFNMGYYVVFSNIGYFIYFFFCHFAFCNLCFYVLKQFLLLNTIAGSHAIDVLVIYSFFFISFDYIYLYCCFPLQLIVS